MANHTPGPWRWSLFSVVTDAPVSANRTYGYGCSDNFICDLDDGEYHNYSDSGEMEANAQLIAAAPDLLAVCESMLERGIYNDQLIYAVRKAKGEQSE